MERFTTVMDYSEAGIFYSKVSKTENKTEALINAWEAFFGGSSHVRVINDTTCEVIYEREVI